MDGLILTPLKRIRTGKGDVLHALRATDAGYCGFGEAYLSEVYPQQRKPWRRHNRMTLNMVVVRGRIRFLIYDDREGSDTRGETVEVVLSPDGDYKRLTLAPGLWFCFEGLGEEASLLLDIIPEVHDPNECDKKEEL